MPTSRMIAAVIRAVLNEPVVATMKPVIVGAKNAATLLRKFMIPPTCPVLLLGAISAGIDQPTGAEWNEIPATAIVIHATATFKSLVYAAPMTAKPIPEPRDRTVLRTRFASIPR